MPYVFMPKQGRRGFRYPGAGFIGRCEQMNFSEVSGLNFSTFENLDEDLCYKYLNTVI